MRAIDSYRLTKEHGETINVDPLKTHMGTVALDILENEGSTRQESSSQHQDESHIRFRAKYHIAPVNVLHHKTTSPHASIHHPHSHI